MEHILALKNKLILLKQFILVFSAKLNFLFSLKLKAFYTKLLNIIFFIFHVYKL